MSFSREKSVVNELLNKQQLSALHVCVVPKYVRSTILITKSHNKTRTQISGGKGQWGLWGDIHTSTHVVREDTNHTQNQNMHA